MPHSETAQRVAVAAVGIPIALALVFLGGWALAALLVVAAVLAALEFFHLAERRRAHPLRVPGAALAAAFVLLAALDPAAGPDAAGFALLIVIAVLGIAVASIWDRGVEGEPLLSVSTTLMGAIYTGALLSFGLFLRHLPGHAGAWHGTGLVFFPVLLTWASDTGAYFVGRRWGTRKLIPRVSPGKTVQGALGALLLTMVVAVGYALLLAPFPTYRVGVPAAVAFGALISVAAQAGDLVESLFKRDAGVKDSGTLLPGHGGALDRFDSLFFTLPLAYLFLRYLVGAQGGP